VRIGDQVCFIDESGDPCYGHLVYYRWPYLYSGVHAEDGHLRTVETHRLLPA